MADKVVVPIFISIAMGAGFMIGALFTLDHIEMMCNESKSFRIGRGVHYSCEVVK